MTPPKPPRRNKPTITCSSDVPQSTAEDPGASMPAVTDGSQSEVKVKPVPRPRSKVPSKVQCDANNTVDTDETSNATNAVSSQLSEYAADYKRLCPARPPRPMSKPTAAVNGGNHYMNLNIDTAVQPHAVSTERIQCLPPPRPPLPSVYCDRPPSTRRLKSESYSDVSQLSRCSPNSSILQTPVSPAPSEEGMSLYGIDDATATDSSDKPDDQPQPWESPLPGSASEWETLSSQSRPPPPPSNPPPLPSTEGVYSEIEHRPYLDILPEDDDGMTHQRSTLPSEKHDQSCHKASDQQATVESEDLNGMLRWLKRVSKTDFMALSVYGLSIEEEIRSFNHRAMNVTQALRLYNLLMIKRNKYLRDLITELCSISNRLDKMQKKTKTMDIAGGTTGAVGGVTAVLGIALAPVTLGTSLIATAVGAGMVASAGGMGVHNAKATKKIVNRITVEKLVYKYEANVVDLELCLDFILFGMNELRRHDIARLHRAGAKPDAVKMVHLSQFVFMNNTSNGRRASISHTSTMSSERLLQAFNEEMDQYFTENGQTLKNSTQSRFSGRVRLLARNLEDELDHLNRMWEMFC